MEPGGADGGRPAGAVGPRPAAWLVIVAVVGSSAAYLPGALHPAMLPKHATVVVAAGALAVLGGWTALRDRRMRVPHGPFAVALVVFAVAVVVTATAADVPALAWTGEEQRYSGALGYLAAVVVAVAIVTVPVGAAAVLGALLVAGGTVLAVAVVQLVVEGTGDLTAQMANPDFLSAYAAMLLPLALLGAVWRWPVWARAGSAALALVAPVVLRGAGVVQGPLAAAAGLAVLAVLWPVARSGRGGRLVAVVPLAVVGAAASVALAGAAGWGPASALAEVPTFDSRTRLWRAAWSMAGEHPATGVGLDRFAAYYHAHRPVSEVVERQLTEAADAAHSVPLQLLATGGVLAVLAWLAVPVAAVLVVARRWHGAGPAGRRMAAGLLAADAAYAVQSLVSIDVPPLLTAHFVLLAGAVVAVGTPPVRAVATGRGPRMAGGAAVLAGTVAVVVAWSALAADLSAGRGARAITVGAHEQGVARLRTATALAPWRAVTAVELARAEVAAGRLERALAAVDLARQRDPRELEALVSGARLAAALGRPDETVRRYAAARRVAPRSPELALAHAAALLDAGRVAEARAIVSDVLRIDPANPAARGLRLRLEDGPADR